MPYDLVLRSKSTRSTQAQSLSGGCQTEFVQLPAMVADSIAPDLPSAVHLRPKSWTAEVSVNMNSDDVDSYMEHASALEGLL